jgi:hypothetical protein
VSTKLHPGTFDCYAKLEPNEPYFLLRGCDPMAAQLVRLWAQGARMRLTAHLQERRDKEVPADYVTGENAKIAEALSAANDMEAWCRKLGRIPMRWSATPPVITRAAPKCDVTRAEVDAALAVAAESDLSIEPYRIIERLARAAGVPE